MIFNITKMPPKRMSPSEVPVLTHATIKKLVAHSVATVLAAQAAIMASTNNPNSKPRKTPIARKCAYKKFTVTNFSTSMVWTELLVSFTGLNGLNRYFLVANVPRRTKRLAITTLTKEALFWWNSFT
ncbi:hypothetical protein Tco_0199679 [Tanacetum coccineum]